MKKTLESVLMGPAAQGGTFWNVVYALFRIYCGYSIAVGAGLSKVFHKINETGGKEWDNLAFGVPDWFVKQVGEIGFTFISPSFWAHVAVYGEFIGGLLIALGLLTRFSALQMAFQFFVVSFIWYDEPELFAMYYQQLIFWSFVLIAAGGGGRFSLDTLLRERKFFARAVKPAVALGVLFLLGSGSVEARNAELVPFTLSNSSLKTREIDIRYFNCQTRERRGYGYSLSGLSSHAVNMPVGTRIYEKQRGQWELLLVITAADKGRKLNVNQAYDISREQWLEVAYAEQCEETEKLNDIAEQPGMEQRAAEAGLEMVSFKIAGKTLLNKTVYVRVELPFEPEQGPTGFSRSLNWFSQYKVRYPVGTKVYLCSGAYWEGREVAETYLFTVDAEKSNYLVRL